MGEIDALLDRLASVTRTIAGHLQAEEIPRLNQQFGEVFESFGISRDRDRLFVQPRLHPEFVPPGNWTVLDFGESIEGGDLRVEVVEYPAADLRKVDLTAGIGGDISHGSS